MKPNPWYSPVWQRERERMKLERDASRLIKTADRRQSSAERGRFTRPAERPALPHKYTLKDLGLLRKRGLLP
jgi:hypothetical protein